MRSEVMDATFPTTFDHDCSFTLGVYEKEGEKIAKYQDLKREVGKLWGIRHLEVVPVVVGALGVVSNRLDGWLEKLGVTTRTGLLQKESIVTHS